MLFYNGLHLPQVFIFSLAPIYLEKLAPTRKMKIGWKLSASEKVITYGLLAITFAFNQVSATAGIAFGILLINWKDQLFIIENEAEDVIGICGLLIDVLFKRFQIEIT